jgi:hypothetical protein
MPLPPHRLALGAALLGAVLASAAAAQDRKVVYPHEVFWSKVEINDIFDNGKWGWGIDGVYRRKNEEGTGGMFDAPLRESVRPWVHYQLSPNARFSVSPLGYMHTNEYVAKPEDREREPYHELRTTLQFFHHHKQLDGRLMHTWRYRYELRWQEQAGRDDYRYTNRFRFRYRARYMLNSDNFYEDGTVYLMASNEIGLNLGREVVLNTFNQNRLYAGVGVRFLNSVRAEARYVDRIRTRGSTGFEFDHGRGLMLAVYIDQLRNVGKKDIPPVRFVE